MKTNDIGMELRALNNLIRKYIEFSTHKKEIESATGNNGWIICYLADRAHQDVYQKDIEDYFTITRSTVSKVLSLMERKGFIERQVVAQDARLKKIVLTDRAWEIRKIMHDDMQKLEAALIAGFSAEEAETLKSLLRRMRENISENHGKGDGIIHD